MIWKKKNSAKQKEYSGAVLRFVPPASSRLFRPYSPARGGRYKPLWLTTIFLLFLSVIGQAELKTYTIGNPVDVKPKLHGPAFHLQGGGTDVDAALQRMIDLTRGCTDCSTKVDVVVLRASGDDDYNDYIFHMKGVNSVVTLVITAREDAAKKEVQTALQRAEVIFFAGGDQCNYVRNFKGTAVEDAVTSLVKRGGGVGGTSAGVAILGDVIYDACNGSTRGFEGLANPYDPSISFTYDFFHFPHLEKTLTDQHLVERDRIGRTFAFLARQIQDKKMKKVLGIAVERETSVLLDKHGIGTIMGKGPAYFILADHRPEVCEPGKPLSYSGFEIWKRYSGDVFNLKNRPSKGYYIRNVKNGVVDADPYAESPCNFQEIEKTLAKLDPAPLKQNLEALFSKCPNDLEPYKYVQLTKDPDFMKTKAAALRRMLDYATTLDRLLYYRSLWELEQQTLDAKETATWQKQVSEDIKRLETEKSFKGAAAESLLKTAHEYVLAKS